MGNIYNWMVLNNNKVTEDNLSLFNFGFMIIFRVPACVNLCITR